MRKTILVFITIIILGFSFISCQETVEHTAPAIHDRDSVPVMVSYGVNTLISDSGVIKYRIVTERWEVNENKKPSRWIFDKGLLLTQFDQSFHVQSYIQCDSAIYLDKDRVWQLHGRVRIHTKQGITFSSEELFWDESKHEMWSYRYSHLVTPERELRGNYFRSDERMTKYTVTNTKGYFERGDFDKQETNPRDSMRQAQRADSATAARSTALSNQEPARNSQPLLKK